MNPATSVTEERSFEMDTQRTRARRVGAAIALGTFHGLSQILQRFQRLIHRRSDGRWAIAGHTVPRHHPFDGRKARAGAFHHVVTCPAVNMDVDESGRKNRIAEVYNARAGRN